MQKEYAQPKKNQRMKRSSKITNGQKTKFLLFLVKQGGTIKDVANKMGINYSSAKLIVKQNQDFLEMCRMKGLENGEVGKAMQKILMDEDDHKKKRCSYKEINKEDSKTNHSHSTSGQPYSIKIISTVSWNFFRDGLPDSN